MTHQLYAAGLILCAVLTLFIMKKKPERKEFFIFLCLFGGWPGLHWIPTRVKWMSAIQFLLGLLLAWKIESAPHCFIWLYLILSLPPALVGGGEIKMRWPCLILTFFSHALYANALYPPIG